MPATTEQGLTPTQIVCLDGPLVADFVKHRIPLLDAARLVINALAVRYLQEADGNITLAAQMADVHRNTFTQYIPADLRKSMRSRACSGRERAKQIKRARDIDGRFVSGKQE